LPGPKGPHAPEPSTVGTLRAVALNPLLAIQQGVIAGALDAASPAPAEVQRFLADPGTDPAEAAAISANAQAFARAHIGPRDFITYWGQLLGEYNKLLGFKLDPPPRGLCTCWPGAAPTC
jgi:hypothetical protein